LPEVAEEHLVARHGGEGGADAAQAREPGGVAVLRRRGDRLLFGLDLGDHLHHLPQPPALAQQLGPQAGRERLAVGRAQRFEARLPVAPRRLEVADALRHQQALDAARVLAPLDHEPGPLARPPSGVLLLGAGHVHDAADPRLAALQRHQRAQQPSDVEAVRLGPPCPAVHQDAGGIQHPVLDAARAQPAVQPEAVVSRLEAAGDAHRPAQLLRRLRPLAREQLEQTLGVATVQPVLADLVADGRVHRHQPRRAAQLQRDEQRRGRRLSKRRRGRG
jgi:hypothetical protein